VTAQFENLVFVDVEATGLTPFSGEMTEFGAVHFTTRKSFHGVLWDAVPDPEIPAKPVIVGAGYPQDPVMRGFASWLKTTVRGRPVFVSDNPAYDFMWIAYYFDKCTGSNPFGHSGRRISDFWAGARGNWSDTQKWKQFRRTAHDHNPVNDSMGNVEAFATIMQRMKAGTL
jgi:DNA polymerase III epsilon subunit-like protein